MINFYNGWARILFEAYRPFNKRDKIQGHQNKLFVQKNCFGRGHPTTQFPSKKAGAELGPVRLKLELELSFTPLIFVALR